MDVACVLLFVHVLRDVTGDYFLKASEFFNYSVNNFYCTMFPHVQVLQSMAVSFLHTTPLHTTPHNYQQFHSTPLHSTLHSTTHNSTPHNSPQLHSTTHNSLQFHSITHNSPQFHSTTHNSIQQLGLSPTCCIPLSTPPLSCQFLPLQFNDWSTSCLIFFRVVFVPPLIYLPCLVWYIFDKRFLCVRKTFYVLFFWYSDDIWMICEWY